MKEITKILPLNEAAHVRAGLVGWWRGCASGANRVGSQVVAVHGTVFASGTPGVAGSDGTAAVCGVTGAGRTGSGVAAPRGIL